MPTHHNTNNKQRVTDGIQTDTYNGPASPAGAQDRDPAPHHTLIHTYTHKQTPTHTSTTHNMIFFHLIPQTDTHERTYNERLRERTPSRGDLARGVADVAVLAAGKVVCATRRCRADPVARQHLCLGHALLQSNLRRRNHVLGRRRAAHVTGRAPRKVVRAAPGVHAHPVAGLHLLRVRCGRCGCRAAGAIGATHAADIAARKVQVAALSVGADPIARLLVSCFGVRHANGLRCLTLATCLTARKVMARACRVRAKLNCEKGEGI